MSALFGTTERICARCRFCRRTWTDYALGGYEFARCEAPQNYEQDVVSGQLKRKAMYCASARAAGCGTEGKWWQKR